METWERLVTVGVVLAATLVAARLIDRAMVRKERSPEAVTRYRVLRRSITVTVVMFGLLSALLVIPQVRALAGALLASTAVVGLIVGFAAQRTLGNFIAGLMIAFTQPVRLGDRVEVADTGGTVEEIGLVYTFIRLDDNSRLVIPNEKLASDTIRNSTIRSHATYAQVTVQVPPTTDLAPVLDELRKDAPGERDEVFVSSLEDSPTLVVRVWADSGQAAEHLEKDLRVRVHRRLREHGLFA
jgi:small-conductance mechanosensitive channel